jgi:cytoskeletal protein CcmA (bactofilin family)
MFNSNDGVKGKEVETIIGPSVKVKGEFNGQGDIIVEGMLEGSLTTASSLRVGEKAKITASVEARNGKISGEVVGNVKCSGYLEIMATAKISGDVEASALSVEKGATLNGKISMSGTRESKTEKATA